MSRLGLAVIVFLSSSLAISVAYGAILTGENVSLRSENRRLNAGELIDEAEIRVLRDQNAALSACYDVFVEERHQVVSAYQDDLRLELSEHLFLEAELIRCVERVG